MSFPGYYYQGPSVVSYPNTSSTYLGYQPVYYSSSSNYSSSTSNTGSQYPVTIGGCPMGALRDRLNDSR